MQVVAEKRYFPIRIRSLNLEVEPPNMKTVKKIMSLPKVPNENTKEELSTILHMILNKNKEGLKVPKELIDELNADQLKKILNLYSRWLIPKDKR